MTTKLTTAARGLLTALSHGRPVRATPSPTARASVWCLEGGESTFQSVATRMAGEGLVTLTRDVDGVHLQITPDGRAALRNHA